MKIDDFCMKLHAKIIELEAKDVSIDDMNDVNYLYMVENKLKDWFNKAYAILQRLLKANPHLVDCEKNDLKKKSGQFAKQILINGILFEIRFLIQYLSI